MTTATYQCLVDWNNDGDFLDTGEDITARVLEAMWERGRDYASSLTGRSISGQCRLLLNNASGDYNSFNSGSAIAGNILPGRKVQIRRTPFFGHALDFDGVDDHVVQTTTTLTDDMFDSGGTVEAYVEVDSDGENNEGRIADKTKWYIYVHSEAGGAVKLGFFYDFSGAADGLWVTDDAVLTVGTRHHIAISYDNGAVGNNPIIYVDGVSKAITESTTPVGTRVSEVGDDLYMGNNAAGSRSFDGKMDEMRFWDDVRTSSEINDNKDSEWTVVPPSVDLAAYFPFNEGSGTTTSDAAHNRDGTISGASWYHTGSILWTGYLQNIEPLPSVKFGDYAVLTAIGPLGYLNNKRVKLAMGTSKATGTSIGEILDEVGWASGERALDAGQTTMDRFWLDEQYLMSALRLVEDTEHGFIAESADGYILFEDRYHRMAGAHLTSQATFSDAVGAARSYLDQPRQLDSLPYIFNDFSAVVQDYTVASIATLWTLSETGGNSPLIAVGASKTFGASYPNPASATNAFAVDAWTTPVATTDMTANSASGGGGTDLTSDIGIAVSKFGNAMKITLTNNHATLPAYITALKARGTGITRDDPIRIREIDATSQTTYGERSFPSDAHFIPTTQEAEDWALYNLSIFKDPGPLLEISLANKDATILEEIMRRNISDRVTLVASNNTGLGINEDFYIEAIQHKVTDGGTLHIMTMRLSPSAQSSDGWVLDTSALDTETRLAY